MNNITKGRTLRVKNLLEFIDRLYINGDDENDLNAIETLHTAGFKTSEIIEGFRYSIELGKVNRDGLTANLSKWDELKDPLEESMIDYGEIREQLRIMIDDYNTTGTTLKDGVSDYNDFKP